MPILTSQYPASLDLMNLDEKNGFTLSDGVFNCLASWTKILSVKVL